LLRGEREKEARRKFRAKAQRRKGRKGKTELPSDGSEAFDVGAIVHQDNQLIRLILVQNVGLCAKIFGYSNFEKETCFRKSVHKANSGQL
jgi:hypothetical protein